MLERYRLLRGAGKRDRKRERQTEKETDRQKDSDRGKTLLFCGESSLHLGRLVQWEKNNPTKTLSSTGRRTAAAATMEEPVDVAVWDEKKEARAEEKDGEEKW